MADGFPCPNPTCAHTFPVGVVGITGSLKCPKCGTLYQFRQPVAQSKPAPATPKAPPVPPKPVVATPVAKPGKQPKAPPPPPPAANTGPPIAAPVQPGGDAAVPVAAPVVSAGRVPDPSLAMESSPDMVLSPIKRKPKGRLWVKWLIGGVVFLLVGTGLTFAVLYIAQNLPDSDSDISPKTLEKAGNFNLTIPGGWRADDKLKMALRVNFAMSRTRPRNHAAVLYREYANRQPTDHELLDEGLRVIQQLDRGDGTRLFAGFQYANPLGESHKGRTGTLGGENAIFVEFSATQADVPMTGQMVLLTRQGYGYWLFVWGPEDFSTQLTPGWVAIRERFKFFNQREGWKPHPRENEAYVSPENGFQFNTFTDVWIRDKNPQNYNTFCEAVYRGYKPTEDEETRKTRKIQFAGQLATVQVLIFPEKADITEAGKAAIEAITKKEQETQPDLKIEPMPDRKTGKAVVEGEVGAYRGAQLHRLALRVEGAAERFAMLGVVQLENKKTLAILCDCRGEQREYWEPEFKALLETVRRAGRK